MGSRSCLITGWLLVAFCGRALGDGVVRDSLGPISSGRGGANLAFGDNLALINDNPAGLVGVRAFAVDLGLDFLTLDIAYDDPQNESDAESELFILPQAGLAWRAVDAPVPVVLGLGLFVPAGFGTEYDLRHAAYGEQRYSSRSALTKLLGTAAVDLGYGFAVGFSLGVARSELEIEMPYTFQTGAFQGVPALVDLDAAGYGWTWNIGLQYRPTDRWRLGLAYIGETRVEVEGRFTADATGVVMVPDPTARYDVEATVRWPRSFGLGTSYLFDCSFRSAAARGSVTARSSGQTSTTAPCARWRTPSSPACGCASAAIELSAHVVSRA